MSVLHRIIRYFLQEVVGYHQSSPVFESDFLLASIPWNLYIFVYSSTGRRVSEDAFLKVYGTEKVGEFRL
jgi:hypothetical protein